MKRIKKLMNCLGKTLKKFFFNVRKNDIHQGCENVFGLKSNPGEDKNENEVEEYLNNYKSTTRWQTV